MTYLATEMLLYLLAAAIIGLTMGWLIWGAGRRRKLDALKSELMERIETEQEAHSETRLALDKADARMREAVEAAKADASRSITEMGQMLDAERAAAAEARSALDRTRNEVEEAIRQGRESGQEALNQALQAADAEKAAASEAMAREAQSRAQIEELRLLIGAEKLAAESARAELEETRASMQASLDAERAAHQQAKSALDDIRSTLARTFGADAPALADQTPDGSSATVGPGGINGPLPVGRVAAFSAATDMTAAGDALNNPDLDEADIEDREDMSLDLSSPIDVEADPEPDVDGETETTIEPLPTSSTERGGLHSVSGMPDDRDRPALLLDDRPDDVDDLQAIDGIGLAIERRLQENGCYRYSQLAALTPEDVDWLAGRIEVTADQIADDRWIEQAKVLAADARADDGRIFIGSTDRHNAAS